MPIPITLKLKLHAMLYVPEFRTGPTSISWQVIVVCEPCFFCVWKWERSMAMLKLRLISSFMYMMTLIYTHCEEHICISMSLEMLPLINGICPALPANIKQQQRRICRLSRSRGWLWRTVPDHCRNCWITCAKLNAIGDHAATTGPNQNLGSGVRYGLRAQEGRGRTSSWPG